MADRSRVFRGPIASSNTLLKDPVLRDYLQDQLRVKAVEMEGSGVADALWCQNGFGYLVIRGTCDYCDSEKNTEWQNYAALIAAAYTRTVIERVHATRVTPGRGPSAISLPRRAALSKRGHLTSVRDPRNREEYTEGVPEMVRSAFKEDSSSSTVGDQDSDVTVMAPEVSIAQEISQKEQSKTPPVEPSTSVDGQYSRLSPISGENIFELVESLDGLIKELRWSETGPIADELEKQLRLFPRLGSQVREGWILLAQVEIYHLSVRKREGHKVDPSRLRDLRLEAERVVG